MIKRFLLFLLVLIGITFALQLALPSIVSSFLENKMANYVQSDSIKIKAEKAPAYHMLVGNFDTITLDAKNTQIDKITFKSMHIVLNEVKLDETVLLQEKKAVLKEVGLITLKAILTEKEISTYLNANVKGLQNAIVSIETDNKATISGELTIGGFTAVGLKLQGRIIKDGKKAKFMPEQFSINDKKVGDSIVKGNILSEITILDASKLPFNVTIKEIISEKGQIIINADNTLI